MSQCGVSVCDKSGLRKCEDCSDQRYCGTVCQRFDRKFHQVICHCMKLRKEKKQLSFEEVINIISEIIDSVDTDYKDDNNIEKATRRIKLLEYCETVIKQEFGDFMGQEPFDIRLVDSHNTIFDFTIFGSMYYKMISFYIDSYNISGNFVEVLTAIYCVQKSISLVEKIVIYLNKSNSCSGCPTCTSNTNRISMFYVQFHIELSRCMQILKHTDTAMENYKIALLYLDWIVGVDKVKTECFCYASKADFLCMLGNEPDFEEILRLRKLAFAKMVVNYGYCSVEVASYVYKFVDILLKLKKYKEAEKYSNNCYKGLQASDVVISSTATVGLFLVGSSIELFKTNTETINNIDYIEKVLLKASV